MNWTDLRQVKDQCWFAMNKVLKFQVEYLGEFVDWVWYQDIALDVKNI